jgi:glycosyltransferase involved in cell wall biosynthesis
MCNSYRKMVVIPAYNEEGKIGKVIRKIPPALVDKVVVVDDCSKDRTALEAAEAGAMVISHERNIGVGAGIRSGIDYAIANQFNVVAILSGDDQHDPRELDGLLDPIL